MMLMGAVAGFSTTLSTGNPWIGLVLAMLVGGLLALLHAIVTIQLRADQVVSGLALTFLGTGLARVLGEGLTNTNVAVLPSVTIPVLSAIPIVGPIVFRNQSVLVYLGFILVPLAWFWIERTRPGLHLRAVGEAPAAADAQGIGVYRLRYAYVVIGGVLAGLAGATITLAVAPGWFGDQTVNGRGWIAIGLVIFARWNPIWAALRGDHALHTRAPGGRSDRRHREPVPPGALRDILPGHASLPVRHRGRDPRIARRAPAEARCTGRAWRAVRPRRTRPLTEERSRRLDAGARRLRQPSASASCVGRAAGCALSSAESPVARPWSSIWTKPLVSNVSCWAP
jgi:hypothetical protein